MDTIHNEDALGWDLFTLSNAIRNKQVSPKEVTGTLLERIEAVNPKINAYITVLFEEAMESAAKAEQEIASGNWKGPLHGVPIGIKDIIYTKNIKTTMGSKIYNDFIPDYDAAVVERLRQAGAVIVGKTNTHQFAYGSTGDRSFFGPVRNPLNPAKMSGGSSSGSAAAVAAGLCYGALGTDSGGSIRIPSALCGIVGMKPTFGRVSKYGVYPLSWSLDHIGPMTRTVQDNAVLLNALSGYDNRDPYSVRTETEDFTRLISQGIKGSIICVPSSFYFEGLDAEVERKMDEALEVLKRLGAEIRKVDIGNIREISLAQQMTIRSEAFTVHEEMLKNQPDKYEEEVKERLLTGEAVKASEYVRAQQIRLAGAREFRKVLTETDVILTPSVPILPPNLEQREVTINGETLQVRECLTRFNGPTNLIGFPSISIPCGFSASGLPIGIQFIGKPYDEANLYRFAYAFERESGIPRANGG
jgi:aspartyl-tRNA(Asn)/glutamyl-tRNA(Gln) amidotransferase subunit A